MSAKISGPVITCYFLYEAHVGPAAALREQPNPLNYCGSRSNSNNINRLLMKAMNHIAHHNSHGGASPLRAAAQDALFLAWDLCDGLVEGGDMPIATAKAGSWSS